MNNLIFLRPKNIQNKIRIGPNFDGGYVLYKPSLDNIDILFNYGVGWDISFEEDFSLRTKKRVHMFDPTMVNDNDYYIDFFHCMKLLRKGRFKYIFRYLQFAIMWKKRMFDLHKKDIYFHNEGLANTKMEKFDTFGNHLKRFNISDENILLKIDIEENEYAILLEDEFYSSLVRVDQVVLEFHNLKNRINQLKIIVEKFKSEYELIHIHGNNHSGTFLFESEYTNIYFPDVVEMTFVKKNSILPQDIRKVPSTYPIEELDYPNNSIRADYSLQFD